MKLFLLSACVAAVLALLVVLFLSRSDAGLDVRSGSMRDLPFYLRALAQEQSTRAFLIVQLAGRDDFFQFNHIEGQYEIDFPLVTERERELEPRVLEAGRRLQLVPRITTGTDGSRFDFDHGGSAEQTATTVEALFRSVFDIGSNVALEFHSAGISNLPRDASE